MCCRSFARVPLTWPEYERLDALGAQRLALSLRGPHWLMIDGGCEFLLAGRCAIYADRPDCCRLFMCVGPDERDTTTPNAEPHEVSSARSTHR